jgi:hypothetical protein
MSSSANSKRHSLYAGWFGGTCVTLVCHPFDTIKIHSQVTHLTAPRTALNLWNDGGLRGFYRGIVSPLAGFGMAYALKFGVYGNMMAYFTRQRIEEARREYEEELRRRREEAERNMPKWKRSWLAILSVTGLQQGGDMVEGIDPDDLSAVMKNAGQVPFHQAVLSAGAGGAAFATVMTPFEVVKLRLVTEHIFEHRQYSGALDCAKQLVEQGGPQKLFIGYYATLLRDVPASILFFGIYGTLRGALLPAGQTTPEDAPISLCAGAIAGAVTWTCVLPADTIKTHMQASRRCNDEGWSHFARQVYRKGGFMGFYVGVTAALFRASFGQAICVTGVETALRLQRVINGAPTTPTGARQSAFPSG